MAGDDLFKRYMEVGASMLGMSRERAESIVRDLVASGEVARGQATKAADWLVERGRTGTEELREMVRKEIRQQIGALGVATRDDIARLEARLQEVQASAKATSPAAPAKRRAARKASGDAAPPKAPGPKPSTAAARATKSAGITRSASVRKRAAGPRATEPDAGSPSGGSRRQKA